MSRTPNLSSGTWLPLWNSNNTDSISSSTEELLDSKAIKKSRSTSPMVEGKNNNKTGSKSRQNSFKKLKSKPSTTSLASMTAGNWLGWSSKGKENVQYEESDDFEEEYEDYPNEVEDHVPGHEKEDEEFSGSTNTNPDPNPPKDVKKNTSSSWNFWNGNNSASAYELASSKNNADDMPKEDISNFSNKILKSTPSIPTKDVLNTSTKRNTKVDKVNNGAEGNTPPPNAENSEEDDAVLYKPHDNAKQFSEINTHKNENLKENTIVPDWDHCLAHQTSMSSNFLPSSIFGNPSTTNETNLKMDLKNWRNFLNKISNSLGIRSQSAIPAVEKKVEISKEPTESKQNREFDFFYEKNYKLYGKSLSKMPIHKRGCLPNYNKFYKETHKQISNILDADNKTIKVGSDASGNFFINSKDSSHQNNYTEAEIVSQKPKSLKKIKKILVIGVHGFFPTRMIRPIIGSPKGTSLKFANEAEKAVIRYCLENNLINEEENSLSIQKIALEKEGKIFDRVKFFTEVLTKWKKELNSADFIFVAAHSQGCVVSVILLATLIEMGILLDPNFKRIGILAMAGINNGPFYGTDKSFFMKAYSAIENESLTELFELSKFNSPQSLAYKRSISMIIRANVKVCFIGSINDQVVPLYSAVASHIFHPNIYRACYIDHASQTPDFIQRLVSLSCHLQNIGYFDNNVVKELSTSLAGPLTGGGHSKIYNDGKVYDLGLKFVLDTDDIVIPSLPFNHEQRSHTDTSNAASIDLSDFTIEENLNIPAFNRVYIKEYNIGKVGTNPFVLPWCLRGLVFNIEKNWPNNNRLLSVDTGKEMGKNGYDQIEELYESFEKWKPESKALKDLKFRLNGLRSSKL